MYRSLEESIIYKNICNINEMPYIKDRTFNELKLKYNELHCYAYDACLDINQMLLKIDYILDYIMKNYTEIGKKDMKNKLKEIEFYTKKPLENFIKLNRLVVNAYR